METVGLEKYIVAISLFFVTRYIALKLHRKFYSYPPGPIGIPFFGFFLQKLAFLAFRIKRYRNWELSKQHYGPIFMYYNMINHPPTVVIVSSKLTKKILSLKPKENALERYARGYKNQRILVLSNDDNTEHLGQVGYQQWKVRRKLAHNALFAMCTSSFVSNIIDETMTKTVIPEIEKLRKSNQLWFPKRLMSYSSFNTIFHSSFGKSADINDTDCIELRKLFLQTFKALANIHTMIWNVIPYFLQFDVLKPKIVLAIRRERCALIRKLIKERELSNANQDNNNEWKPVSYIDHMLYAMKVEKKITRSEMEADVGTLFAAGTDTTASALEFAIILAAKHADIQRKVRDELISVFGKENKFFDISKLSELPLFRAFIKETQRISSVATKAHRCVSNDDIWIDVDETKRYRIPKGATIAYGIRSVHLFNENEDWIGNGNYEIELGNWLSENDNGQIKFKQNKSEMTFGYGQRDCAGQMLAMKELHIVIGYLMLMYRFEFDSNYDKTKKIKMNRKGIVTIDPPIGVVVSAV